MLVKDKLQEDPPLTGEDMLLNIHYLVALKSIKYLCWPGKLHGSNEESIYLCIKEGLRRAFLGTGCSFEAGDIAWVNKFKYYFIGTGKMMNVSKPTNQFSFSVRYLGWQ